MKKIILIILLAIIATPAIIANKKVESYFKDLEGKDFDGIMLTDLEIKNKYYETIYTYKIKHNKINNGGLPIKTTAKFMPHETIINSQLNLGEGLCSNCSRHSYKVTINHLDPSTYSGELDISDLREGGEKLDISIQRLTSSFRQSNGVNTSKLSTSTDLGSFAISFPDNGMGRDFSLLVKNLKHNSSNSEDLKEVGKETSIHLTEFSVFDLLEVRDYSLSSESKVMKGSHLYSEHSKAGSIYVDKSLDTVFPRIYGYEYKVDVSANGSVVDSISQYIEHNQGNFSKSMNSFIANVIDKKHHFATNQNPEYKIYLSIQGEKDQMLSLTYNEKGLRNTKDSGEYIIDADTKIELSVKLTDEFIGEFSKFYFVKDILNLLISEKYLIRNSDGHYTLEMNIDSKEQKLNNKTFVPNHQVLSNKIRKLDKKVI